MSCRENIEYRLGWLPDVPDVRDLRFSDAYRAPARLPASVDLRERCSPVEDQGNLGSCTAQALVGALEYLQIASLNAARKDLSKYRDLSRLFVYYNTRVIMGTVKEDSGAMLRTGIKSLKKQGVCREILWPYIEKRFTDKPPVKSYEEALNHKVVSYQRLETVDEMKSCLAMGLPFVFGFAVYDHVFSRTVRKTGVIRMPRKREKMHGGHAVMAVGYLEKKKQLLFRNSWGGDWGRGGYGYMPFDYIASRELTDDFWCVHSTESDFYAAYKLQNSSGTA